MKLTIESTPETAHANGLPVRVWTGTTERGTRCLVLVTRVAVPDDAPPDELEQLESELTEAPTAHGVYGAAPQVAARRCTVCGLNGKTVPSTHIATAKSGMQWFECGSHGPDDHAVAFGGDAGETRVALEPLVAWFARHELTVPGAPRQAAGPFDEPTLTEARAALDGGMRVPQDDGDLGRVLWETLATASPPFGPNVFAAAVEALTRQLDAVPEQALHRCSTTPPIVGAVLRALLAHPRMSADGVGVAGQWLAFALRGAQLAWHVRTTHSGDLAIVARIGAPLPEPHRSAWLDGFRIGATTGSILSDDHESESL